MLKLKMLISHCLLVKCIKETENLILEYNKKTKKKN